MQKLLELKNLVKHYPIRGGIFRRQVNSVKAVDGIDLDIYKGECLGLVGESGCGKTTVSKTIVRLHDPTSGEIHFHKQNGSETVVTDISRISHNALKKSKIRGKLQMVFQDPTTSMDPRMLIKNVIAEPIKGLEKTSSRELESRIIELLNLVGLSKYHLLRYPHEFSGGQRQRIAVARAIATKPDFIVLDEPTSALDVSVQAQILNLLKKLQEEFNLTYLFVTHHLLVVKYISTRIAVMYLGKIVESAPTDRLFERPVHPYTNALLSGIPVPNVNYTPRPIILSGDVPSPIDPPPGCRFSTRCPFVKERCSAEIPKLKEIEPGHSVACHLASETEKLIADKYGSR